MNWLRLGSLKTRLILISTVTTTVALLVCAVTLVTFDRISFRRQIGHELQIEGKVLGSNCSAALSFGDPKNAKEVLSALSANDRIKVASVYDLEGKVFASYQRSAVGIEVPARLPQLANASSAFFTVQPIENKGERLGWIYLQGGEREFAMRSRAYYEVTLFALLIGVFLASIIATRLQQVISRPIAHLGSGMAEITQSKDYTLRIGHASEDEIGQLVKSFNLMLAEIESRDADLEMRVEDRTKALSQEISAREQTQKDLSVALKNSNAANLAKSMFLANMSHEIRTPMSGVIGMTELLLGQELTPEVREGLETISGSGRMLLLIIDDILDISKIEAGRIEIETREFRLSELFHDVLRLHLPLAMKKGIALRLDIDWSAERVVMGDSVRLTQVIGNLVGNAVKFTSTGEVLVRARVSELGADLRLDVDVLDTGEGIAPDRLETIFAPFTQEDNSTTRRFGGTGLGLTISRELVAKMGGTIRVDSVLGAGTTFNFDIGLKPQVADGNGILTHGRKPKEDLAPLRQSLHVLLVEDNLTNQKVATRILQRLGCEVTLVENGLLAVEKFEVGFDVILMDCHMPEMDGFEATRKIREIQGDAGRTPIIAITASALALDRIHCLEAGMDDVLAKPFHPAQMKQVLEKFQRYDPATELLKKSAAPRRLRRSS